MWIFSIILHELYSKLYEIIIQSEYIRHFIILNSKKECAFNECPFLEVSPTKLINIKSDLITKKVIEKTEKNKNSYFWI